MRVVAKPKFRGRQGFTPTVQVVGRRLQVLYRKMFLAMRNRGANHIVRFERLRVLDHLVDLVAQCLVGGSHGFRLQSVRLEQSLELGGASSIEIASLDVAEPKVPN